MILKVIIIGMSFLFLFNIIFAQGGKLLSKKEFDYKKTEYYKRISEKKDFAKLEKTKTWIFDRVKTYLISYSSDSLQINGLLITPVNEGKHPCIIFNKGGTGSSGNLSMGGSLLKLAYFSANGYVVISTQFRGQGGSEGREDLGGNEIDDVISLVDVLGELECADTSRIGMFGWSRGGMTTYITLRRTNMIKAAVIGAGISNLFTFAESDPRVEALYAKLIPGYKTNRKKVLTERSAVFWAEEICKTTQILLMHYRNDTIVDPEQSLEMANELYRVNQPFRFMFYEEGGHNILSKSKEGLIMVLGWFDRFLKTPEERRKSKLETID